MGWIAELLYPVSQVQQLARIERKLSEIDGKLSYLMKKGAMMDAILQALEELGVKVTALETVEASAIELLTSIKKALDDALLLGKAEQVAQAVKAISDKLGVDTEKLSKAVVDNTPAAPVTDPVV